MLFRFNGDYTGKRSSITLFGVTFEGREPADVTDADGIRRLSNHPEFEAVTKPVTEIEKTPPISPVAVSKPRGRPKGKR